MKLIRYQWVKLAGFDTVEKLITDEDFTQYLEWNEQGRLTILSYGS